MTMREPTVPTRQELRDAVARLLVPAEAAVHASLELYDLIGSARVGMTDEHAALRAERQGDLVAAHASALLHGAWDALELFSEEEEGE